MSSIHTLLSMKVKILNLTPKIKSPLGRSCDVRGGKAAEVVVCCVSRSRLVGPLLCVGGLARPASWEACSTETMCMAGVNLGCNCGPTERGSRTLLAHVLGSICTHADTHDSPSTRYADS